MAQYFRCLPLPLVAVSIFVVWLPVNGQCICWLHDSWIKYLWYDLEAWKIPLTISWHHILVHRSCDTQTFHSFLQTMASINGASGYDLQWVEAPSDDLKCLICLCVARNPQQHPGDDRSPCGKVFCLDCITKHQRRKTTCPNCRQNLSLFPDARSKPHSWSSVFALYLGYTLN